MSTIAELAVNAVVNTQGVSKGVSDFRSEVGGLRSFVMSNTSAIAGGVATAITADLALIKSQSGIAEQLQLNSQRVGTSVENLSRYRFAAKEAAEVGTEQLDEALARMNTNVGLAAQGAGRAGESIKELGLDAKKLAGLETDSRVQLLADAISHVGDEADRARLTERIFGNGQLVNMLSKGAAGMRELADEADRLGITVDGKTNKAIADADRNFDDFGRNLATLQREIAGSTHLLSDIFVGVPAEILKGMSEMIHDVREFLGFAAPIKKMAETHDQAAAAADRHAKKTRDAADAQKELKKAWEEYNERVTSEQQGERLRTFNRITDTKDQIATFGLTGAARDMAMVRRHRTTDVGDNELLQQLEILDRLEKAKDRATEAEKKHNQEQERASAIVDRSLKPLEKLQKELDEIAELKNKGLLTDQQALAAAESLRPDKEVGRRGPNAAIRFGSAEAFRAIAASREQNDTPKKQLKEAEKTNVKLDEAIDVFKMFNLPNVAPWS